MVIGKSNVKLGEVKGLLYEDRDLQHRDHLDLRPQASPHDQEAIVTESGFSRADSVLFRGITLQDRLNRECPLGLLIKNHVPGG